MSPLLVAAIKLQAIFQLKYPDKSAVWTKENMKNIKTYVSFYCILLLVLLSVLLSSLLLQ